MEVTADSIKLSGGTEIPPMTDQQLQQMQQAFQEFNEKQILTEFIGSDIEIKKEQE